MAGIKFKMIGVPQPEDVIRASSRGIIKSLDNVNEQVIEIFRDTAREIIDKCGGDPEKALCTALAFMSGYYKHTMMSRS
jgi:ATP-dependent RNA helicase DDX21